MEFRGGWADVWRANLWCRVASRILVRVAEFTAETFPELDRGLRAVPWAEWLPPGAPLEVRAAKHKTRLYHTGKVAEIVLEALAATAGARPAAEGEEPLTVHVRIDGPRATVSLDASGYHLHRRGYRTEAGPAPLRENLAAGLLLRARWDGAEPLLDPFCGSGTFPVEGAMLALRIAPGLRRSFAFERFPSHRAEAWAALKAVAQAAARRALPAPVRGSDRDPAAVALTARSARRAGLADHVQVGNLEVGELEVQAPSGLLATNPPYGHRLAGSQAALGDLGRALRGPLREWRWAAILPEGRGAAEARLGLSVSERFPFRSGGLRLQWAQGGPANSTEEST